MPKQEKPRLHKGFAVIKERDPERQREIARKGGASLSPDKRSFSKDRALASRAGALGGKTSRRGPAKQKVEETAPETESETVTTE